MAKKKAPVETWPKVYESYKEPDGYQFQNKAWENPYCFNGIVSLHQYRITVQRVEEPTDVILDRARSLYATLESRSQDTLRQYVLREYGVDLREQTATRNISTTV
jgi:hypothetical protein